VDLPEDMMETQTTGRAKFSAKFCINEGLKKFC